jgi:hypothetical protein
VARRISGTDTERSEQVPLFEDRMAREQVVGAIHRMCIHPCMAGHAISDAPGCAARPRQPRASRPAVKVYGDVEAPRAQAPCPREIVTPSRETGSARDHEEFVDRRVAANHRCGQRFNEIGEVRVRVRLPQRTEQRRGEDDVADQAQADEENVHKLRFDGGLVDEHHRNIVLDRIHPVALIALERRVILYEFDGRFAARTGENREQFGIDGHEPSNYNILS